MKVENPKVLCTSYLRQKAVRLAWEREIRLVRQGRGTRDWTPAEQKELLETGRIKKYVGHHILSVKGHAEFADCPDNIQFLTRAEHFKAHLHNWRWSLNLRYDYKLQSIHLYRSSGFGVTQTVELKTKYCEVIDQMNALRQQYENGKRAFEEKLHNFLEENAKLSQEKMESNWIIRTGGETEDLHSLMWEFKQSSGRDFFDAYCEKRCGQLFREKCESEGLMYQQSGSTHKQLAYAEFAKKLEKETMEKAERMREISRDLDQKSDEQSRKAREIYKEASKAYFEASRQWGSGSTPAQGMSKEEHQGKSRSM